MKKSVFSLLIIFVVIVNTSASIQATTLVLQDMSGSMKEELGAGQLKVNEAFRVIRDVVVPDLTQVKEISGLWSFGGNCKQLRYQGQISSSARSMEQDLLRVGSPSGKTPLAWAIRQALQDLRNYPAPHNLIVVTDGIESCGGDPCQEVINGRAQQMKISIHTVGLGMSRTSGDFKVLECIAANSHGGIAVAIDQPGTSVQQVTQSVNQSFKKVTQNIVQQNGELIVTVLNSKGLPAQGVGYQVKSVATGQIVKQGKSGLTLPLSPGSYQIAMKNQIQQVEIVSSQRKEIQFKIDLGYLQFHASCADPNMTLSLLDDQKNTVATASLGDKGIDLAPGTYYILLMAYPYLPPQKVEIRNNSISRVDLGSFGEVIIHAEDAAGQAVHLPLEVFDDTGQYGTMPVATGSTSEVFRLPVGVYNIRVAPGNTMTNQMQGGSNIQVVECQKAGMDEGSVELSQEAAIVVKSNVAGDAILFNDNTGEQIPGRVDELIGVQPGNYNIMCPSGEIVPNITIENGTLEVTCP